jgi:hypothetical protein
MKQKRFIHVGFSFDGSEPPISEIEKAFNKASDWLRYESHCWILHTAADMVVWQDRIRKIPGLPKNTSFLLIEFSKTGGYMEKWVWDWLKERSDK